jgi:hypothetical protein
MLTFARQPNARYHAEVSKMLFPVELTHNSYGRRSAAHT